MSETIVFPWEQAQRLHGAAIPAPGGAGVATDFEARPVRAHFTGDGAEYFRIWSVNILLTTATLGIYSAWAKVRREQYFHRNTRLAGAAFDYHADPRAILRGRLVAVGALVLMQLSGLASLVLSLALAISFPWLIVRALRFRLQNTSHRGLRFRFHGTPSGAARCFIGMGVLALLSFGFLAPLRMQRIARFRVGNAGFGAERFGFDATPDDYFRLCLRGLACAVATALITVVTLGIGMSFARWPADQASLPIPAGAIPFFAALLAAGATLAIYLRVEIPNLVWRHTKLGPHRFACDQRIGSWLAMELGNAALALATLGLFRPFAAVRRARYHAEHFVLIPGASLDAFVAGAADDVAAAGEEIADVIGLDVGF